MNDRPRIYMRAGLWRCGEMLTLFEDWAIGFGATPREAYDNWKLTRRNAFPHLKSTKRIDK